MYTQLLTYETCGITNAMVKRKLICLTRAKKGKRLLVEPQFFIRKTRNSQPKSTQCARAPSPVRSMRRMDEKVCVWERRHDRDYDFSMTIDGTLVSVENTIITHYSYGSIQFVSFFFFFFFFSALTLWLRVRLFYHRSQPFSPYLHFNSVDKFFVSLSTLQLDDFFNFFSLTHTFSLLGFWP